MSRKTPLEKMAGRMFGCGILFQICLTALWQDFLGKTDYILHLEKYWTYVPWGIWFIPLIIIFIIVSHTQKKAKDIDLRIMFLLDTGKLVFKKPKEPQ